MLVFSPLSCGAAGSFYSLCSASVLGPSAHWSVRRSWLCAQMQVVDRPVGHIHDAPTNLPKQLPAGTHMTARGALSAKNQTPPAPDAAMGHTGGAMVAGALFPPLTAPATQPRAPHGNQQSPLPRRGVGVGGVGVGVGVGGDQSPQSREAMEGGEGRVADGEEDEFVPEEEEEGALTQGDHLLLRKARRQSSGDSASSASAEIW